MNINLFIEIHIAVLRRIHNPQQCFQDTQKTHFFFTETVRREQQRKIIDAVCKQRMGDQRRFPPGHLPQIRNSVDIRRNIRIQIASLQNRQRLKVLLAVRRLLPASHGFFLFPDQIGFFRGHCLQLLCQLLLQF